MHVVETLTCPRPPNTSSRRAGCSIGRSAGTSQQHSPSGLIVGCLVRDLALTYFVEPAPRFTQRRTWLSIENATGVSRNDPLPRRWENSAFISV